MIERVWRGLTFRRNVESEEYGRSIQFLSFWRKGGERGGDCGGGT
jgi:hypothetical protein